MEYERYEDKTEGNKRFEFTGTGAEYFSVWIVNVALTIVTLGIYSAWAKVRTQQYFYGNTQLDGSSFRYTAQPIQILKGRAIAFVVLLLYSAVSNLQPILAGSAFIALMLLVPAFLVLSMAFRLKNSEYRNVRFNFDKNFKQAYKVFSIPVILVGAYVFVISQIEPGQTELPIVGLVLMASIAFMFPWWEYMVTAFKVENVKYGNSDFSFSATTKNYYGMYLKMYGLLLLVMLVLAGLFNLITVTDTFITKVLLVIIIPLFYFWFFSYMQAKRTNLLYNNLNISGNKVNSELKVNYLFFLYFTNTLAMVLSLGLLMPWAKVRTAKYRASVTSLHVVNDLERFVAAQAERQSALGEEMGEMFDMDLGF